MPSELLVVRRRGETIRPVFMDADSQHLGLVNRLLGLFEEHVGQSREALTRAVREVETSWTDYRQVRGLAHLIERRCEFAVRAAVEPRRAREELFTAAASKAIPTTDEERTEIVAEVAARLGVQPEDLEASLYADLQDAQVLVRTRTVTAEELLKEYNVGLTQTLLFQCVRFSFTQCEDWKRMFRLTKRLGLMYEVTREGGEYWTHVDGPLTATRLTRRYGTRLARLLPHIVRAPEWELRATVLDRAGGSRERVMVLDSRHHGRYLGSGVGHTVLFDSEVERDFAQRFGSASTGWKLIREPSPLPVAGSVMLPDFAFERFGHRVYMEIVGFWTQEYLSRKLHKLSGLRGVDMLVAVDRTHACSAVEALRDTVRVFYYSGKVPLRPVISWLKEKEQALVEGQLQHLEEVGMALTGTVVTIGELATENGVLEGVMQQYLRAHMPEGYALLGDLLIDEDRLAEVRELLASALDDGRRTLAEVGRTMPSDIAAHLVTVIEHLGYSIEWGSLDPDEAIVRPPQRDTGTP